MAYQTLIEFNRTGLSGLFLYVATLSPIFTPMLLFTLFIIVLMGTYYAQLRTTGYASITSSFVAAAFFQFLISIILTMIPGMISLPILGISFSILVVAILVLFFANRN